MIKKAGLVPVKIKVSKRTWLSIHREIENCDKSSNILIVNENSRLLLGGVVVSSFEVLVDKVVQLGVIEGSKDPAEHVDFVGNVEAAGIVVELLGF